MTFSRVDATDRYVEFNPATTGNITKPTGTASGDFGLILVSYYENGATLNTPSGWTSEGSLAFRGSSTTESRIAIFSRSMDGSEGANFTVDASGDIYGTAVCFVLRSSNGAITFGSATAGTPQTASPAIAPSVSGTITQALVCAFGFTSNKSVTTPAGMTLGPDGGSIDESGQFFYEILAATGATGTRSASFSGAGFDDTGAWSILLTEPAGGSPAPALMGQIIL